MTDEIRIVYELAENMSKTFDAGKNQLEETQTAMQNLASQLEEGALLGRGGDAFVDAIRGQLCPSLAKLTAKFEELKGDVDGAISDMQQADEASSGKF